MYKILKRCRTDHKYTCKEMAKMLKISPSYYSQIENGKRKLDYKMAVKIASIFDPGRHFELLHQPRTGYPPLDPGMPFSEGDASGFDDVFPSMGEQWRHGSSPTGDAWRHIPAVRCNNPCSFGCRQRRNQSSHPPHRFSRTMQTLSRGPQAC